MVNEIITPEASGQEPEDEKPGDLNKKRQPSFQTPEQAASHDLAAAAASDTPVKKSWRDWRPTKKQAAIIAVVVFLLAGGLVSLALTHKAQSPKQSVKQVVAPKPKTAPTTVPSTLTGLPVAPSVNQKPVTGVIIENSLQARPQSGLDQAGVVFEAIAEGGITRFLALYQDTQPSYIGPVRSARPYFVQWCLGFDCALAHVGGSPEALTDITNWGVKDLNQFYNGSYYQRISSRYAPHNVYTSMTQLNALEVSKGFGAPQFTGFARKPDQPSKSPTAASIDLTPSSYYYNVHYAYDAKTNSYDRSEGGQPHMEINQNGTQTQISPKVVIALVMQYGLEADGYHSVYNVVGSGQAYIFQDGTVTIGTWQKTSMTSQITFTDSSGKPIRLDSGQTWLTAVGSSGDISYKP